MNGNRKESTHIGKHTLHQHLASTQPLHRVADPAG